MGGQRRLKRRVRFQRGLDGRFGGNGAMK